MPATSSSLDPPAAGDVTALLRAWRSGDQGALDELAPLVYADLRRLAAYHLGSERASHTLQATALAHEAFLRLVKADVPWQDRAHFMAVAARAMRRILVDHARARAREKRGGATQRISLEETVVLADAPQPELLELDSALHRLAELDERKARAIELVYFGGLTQREASEALGTSLATVECELRQARTWLHRELGG
jgi:RNA polymerase sigma factor (TIGR02999 family)